MNNGHGPIKCDLCQEVWLRCRCMGPHEEKIERCEECKASARVAGTLANIRARRLTLQAKGRDLDAQRRRHTTELEILIRDCTHPKKRTYSSQGELGEICDDCGWQT